MKAGKELLQDKSGNIQDTHAFLSSLIVLSVPNSCFPTLSGGDTFPRMKCKEEKLCLFFFLCKEEKLCLFFFLCKEEKLCSFSLCEDDYFGELQNGFWHSIQEPNHHGC
jgi:hypothetical protein